MGNVYDDSSIRQLKGADRVRKRPSVNFGTDDIKGAFHTVTEVMANSMDEARAGYGKLVEVTYHADNSISLRDYGRGVPMGYNEKEGLMNWHLIFNELYAGGKYGEIFDEEDEDSTEAVDVSAVNYVFPLGLNGLGAASTQYTSEWFKVISYRDGKVFKKDFVKGAPTDEELIVEDATTEETGTFIHWKIDNEVFADTNFTTKMFTDFFESQAYINSVVVVFKDEHNGFEAEYVGKGIEAYLKEKLGDVVIDTLYKERTNSGVENGKKYLAKAEIILAITEETDSTYMYFHNTSIMRTGAHYTAFEQAVNDFFKQVGRENGVNITRYDYNNYVSVLISSYSSIVSFAGQTKDGVSNMFIYNLVYTTVRDMLEEAVAMQKESITTLVNNVVITALARKKAKEIEQQEKQIKKATSVRKKKPEKYAGCKSNNPAEKELFIVEGDSAKGACEKARDSRFQAILPVKGKPLNCLKAPLKRILGDKNGKTEKEKIGNKEIQDIISIIGTGVCTDDIDLFDESKCEFDKIIFATDADVDGFQIRVLLYTVFYRLMPKLLEQGKIYVAASPLFSIDLHNGESLFAYTPEEHDEIMADLRSKGITPKRVDRIKGLGQTNPRMLSKSTMHPDTRKLIQLKLDTNSMVVREISNMLFGDDPNKERKGFIFSLLEERLGADAELIDLVDTVEAMDAELYADDEDMELAY